MRTTINIATRSGKPDQITGHTFEHGGERFLVHRPKIAKSNGWKVTHVKTGAGVNPIVLPGTKSAAIEICKFRCDEILAKSKFGTLSELIDSYGYPVLN